MKLVPSLKDMIWLGDFGEYIDEKQNDEKQLYEMEDSFEGTRIVCTPVKSVSSIREVDEDNWIAATTILSCPVLLILRAKKMQVIPEFLEPDTNGMQSKPIKSEE
jgi:hypothetical protein